MMVGIFIGMMVGILIAAFWLAVVKGKRSAAAESGSAPAKGCADRAAVKQPEAVSYAVGPTESDLAALIRVWRDTSKEYNVMGNHYEIGGNEVQAAKRHATAYTLIECADGLESKIAANARRSAGEQASRRNAAPSHAEKIQ
jgi:hypothetical protein